MSARPECGDREAGFRGHGPWRRRLGGSVGIGSALAPDRPEAIVSKKEPRVVGLRTRRYSALVSRILEEYGRGSAIILDNRCYEGPEVSNLSSDWCTNRMIRATREFRVLREGVALFGFHDSPEEFWAAESERAFVERLVAEKLVRIDRPRSLSPERAARIRRGQLGCTAVLVLLAVGFAALLAKLVL